MSYKQDLNGTRTAQDIERKYKFSSASLEKNIQIEDEKINKVENELNQFVGSTLEALNDLDEKIDDSLAYIVEINSSNGTVFKNGDISTVLTIKVRKSNEDITDQITDTQVSWTRVSKDSAGDIIWNNNHQHTKSVAVSSSDIFVKAVFNVSVDLSNMEE